MTHTERDRLELVYNYMQIYLKYTVFAEGREVAVGGGRQGLEARRLTVCDQM